jgi:hypothetical protein
LATPKWPLEAVTFGSCFVSLGQRSDESEICEIVVFSGAE